MSRCKDLSGVAPAVDELPQKCNSSKEELWKYYPDLKPDDDCPVCLKRHQTSVAVSDHFSEDDNKEEIVTANMTKDDVSKWLSRMDGGIYSFLAPTNYRTGRMLLRLEQKHCEDWCEKEGRDRSLGVDLFLAIHAGSAPAASAAGNQFLEDLKKILLAAPKRKRLKTQTASASNASEYSSVYGEASDWKIAEEATFPSLESVSHIPPLRIPADSDPNDEIGVIQPCLREFFSLHVFKKPQFLVTFGRKFLSATYHLHGIDDAAVLDQRMKHRAGLEAKTRTNWTDGNWNTVGSQVIGPMDDRLDALPAGSYTFFILTNLITSYVFRAHRAEAKGEALCNIFEVAGPFKSDESDQDRLFVRSLQHIANFIQHNPLPPSHASSKKQKAAVQATPTVDKHTRRSKNSSKKQKAAVQATPTVDKHTRRSKEKVSVDVKQARRSSRLSSRVPETKQEQVPTSGCPVCGKIDSASSDPLCATCGKHIHQRCYKRHLSACA